MSNEAVLGIVALISLGAFFNGWRFARMKTNPWAEKTLLGQPIEGHDLSVKQINRFGYLLMAAGPISFIGFAAIVLFGGVAFRA